MDQAENETGLLAAGKDFLDVLKNLGLEPEGSFWAVDKDIDQFVLVLMTSAFDVVGPLAISEKIVQAYRASALPSIISPFMVRLHSPQHHAMQQLLNADFRTSVVRKALVPVLFELGGTPYEVMATWVYKFESPAKPSTVELLRKWKRFERNVEALAA